MSAKKLAKAEKLNIEEVERSEDFAVFKVQGETDTYKVTLFKDGTSHCECRAATPNCSHVIAARNNLPSKFNPIRLAHTGDIHIGNYRHSQPDPKTGIESRLLDYEKSWIHVCGKAAAYGVDVFLVAGDLFHKKIPTPTEYRAAMRGLEILKKAEIPVIMIPGNHDGIATAEKANALAIFNDRPHVFVASKPELIELDRVQIACVPWFSKSILAGEEIKEVSDIKKLLSKRAKDQIKRLSERLIEDKPAVLLSHFTVSGSVFSSGQEAELLSPAELVLPRELFGGDVFDYVALGHLHNHQEFDKKIVYSGSIECSDFGEENEKKGFYAVEIGDDYVKPEFADTPVREFWTIGNSAGSPFDPEIFKEEVENAIVRVKIQATEEEAKQIDRAAIKRTLYEAGAHYVTDIQIEVDREDQRRNENLTESLTPQAALREFAKENDGFLEHAPELLALADELLAEVA